MHVLFLNRSFPPDVEATGQYLAELTEDLSRRQRVSVVCGSPSERRPRGFPYRWERRGEVSVCRAWGTRWPRAAMLPRAVNYASFYASAALALKRMSAPDVVVSLTDPPFLGLLAVRMKERLDVPFVYYCEDIYPDVAQAVGMAPPPVALALERAQRRILGAADRIVALADDMAERLIGRGVPERRIRVIRNWADTDEIRPIKRHNGFRREHALSGKFVVMYSGNFGYVWDLDVVLDVARRLRDDPRVAFLLVGGGSTAPHLERRVRNERLSNVRFLPYQPRERLSESLSAADLHLVPMRPGVFGTVVPSKVYGILASGTPLIALAEPESEAARVVTRERCGWVGRPGDRDALHAHIQAAVGAGREAQAMGRRAREAAERRYSRARQTARFNDLLEEVLRDGRGTRRPEPEVVDLARLTVRHPADHWEEERLVGALRRARVVGG